MKKLLVTLALLAGALHILSAVPAYPGKILMKQPDGSTVVIRLHGDEWFHYATDESGQVVARGEDGFFRPAPMPSAAEREEAVEMRHAARRVRAAAAKAPSLTQGRLRVPVILVNFNGKEFVTDDPKTAFSNLLNQTGYSANGGTGSVHDYYSENSRGAFDPVFEVYGPVTLSKDSEYYAYNQTGRAGEALREACNLLNSEIDFSKYDSDSDGSVDITIMIYAGYSQAEGGGEDTIWPHQGYTSGRFDGKNLGAYLCTAELRGNRGNQMCGIGTVCHEFGHSLGLPDFYDTDYEENGESGGLYSFSIMSSGSYNNNGCTPPYLNSEERMLLGWGEEQTPFTGRGSVTLAPVQDGVAYRTETTMAGEYFVYECRTKTGWDRYIPSGGLVVYHVDKSNRGSLNPSSQWASYYTPERLWSDWGSTNAINAFGDHPCFYIIPAAAQQSLNYTKSGGNIPFPGSRNVTSYNPVDWQEAEGDFHFRNIAFDGSRVTMTVEYNSVAGIRGTVMNTSAKPVRGAVVTLRAATGAAAAPAGTMAVRRAQGAPLMTVTTDMDGTYQFEDESLYDASFVVSVACDGYVEAEARVSVGRKVVTRDFYLRKVGESEESTFCYYDPASSSFVPISSSGVSGSNVAASIHVSAEEASAQANKQLKLISFQLHGDESSSADAVYVFVEAGGRRKFTQEVETPKFGEMNTVNVIGQGCFIQAGQDMYIGYGVVNPSEAYPILAQECDEDHVGYMGTFNVSRVTSWKSMQTGDGKMYTPVLSAAVGAEVEPELGFNHIANPGNGTYSAGSRFNLELVRYEEGAPSSVSWMFDGRAVQGGSVTLTAGSHTVEARLTYPDGAVEVIRLVITAK